MKIGVCGTGRMGSSIAQRLIAVGHEVGVWNRDMAKTKPLTEAGAKAFASPAELVEACDAIIVMLLNDAASDAVYRGPSGLLKGKLAGKLVIDMSTVRPDTMQTVGAAVLQRGAAFVECPVGGSIGPAREGKLFALVGGEQADIARAKPVLEQLCRRIEHVGALGSGATVKLNSDEGARRSHRQGLGRSASGRDRLQPQRREKRPRHRDSVREIHPCRASGRGQRDGLFRASGSRRPRRCRRDHHIDALAAAAASRTKIANLKPLPIQQQVHLHDRPQESLWPHRSPHP